MGLTNNRAMFGKDDAASVGRDAESHKILGIERRGRWGATDRDRGMRWGSDNRMCAGSMRGGEGDGTNDGGGRAIGSPGSPGKRSREGNEESKRNREGRRGRQLNYNENEKDGEDNEGTELSETRRNKAETTTKKKEEKKTRIESVNVHSLALQRTKTGAAAGSSSHPLRKEPNKYLRKLLKRMEEKPENRKHKRTAIWILPASQLPKEDIGPVKDRIRLTGGYECSETHGVPGQKSRKEIAGVMICWDPLHSTGDTDKSRNKHGGQGYTEARDFQRKNTTRTI